jgi:hypothetical protein
MKTTLNVLLSGLLLMLTSCVTLYEPNAIHSPMLKEKGELNTSASLGASGCGLFNLQSSYALSNHLGVMVDGMYHHKNTSTDTTGGERLNILFGEAGAGYFTPFGENKEWLFQCYGGGGYGITNDKFEGTTEPDPQVNAEYYNVFIQPGFSYKYNYFETAFDLRANYIQFLYIHAYDYPLIEWWDPDLNMYSDTTLNFIILEPALTFKIGEGNLKGVLQLGVTLPLINSDAYLDVQPYSFLLAPLFKLSAGISYNFGTK